MHQSCVRSFGESYVQSYHLVRRLEEVMRKIYRCHVKKLSYKKLVGKKLCIKVTSIVKVVLKNYHLEVIVMLKNIIQ